MKCTSGRHQNPQDSAKRAKPRALPLRLSSAEPQFRVTSSQLGSILWQQHGRENPPLALRQASPANLQYRRLASPVRTPSLFNQKSSRPPPGSYFQSTQPTDNDPSLEQRVTPSQWKSSAPTILFPAFHSPQRHQTPSMRSQVCRSRRRDIRIYN
jgi:hypothetical protein